MTTILLTNDDGYLSKGIRALYTALSAIGDVFMVAPDRDNSAVSHSLTMNRPLRATTIEDNIITVDGTPADCVNLAVKKLLPTKPDLLVSGINHGPNIGDDISYSGTVSAAIEGTIHSIPSLAFSLAEKDGDFEQAALLATKLVNLTLKQGLPANSLLNINIPAQQPYSGIKITRQGTRKWSDSIKETTDPWGTTLYWIGGGTPVHDSSPDTDVNALLNHFISITPIHLDKTSHEGVLHMKKAWPLSELLT